MQPAQNQQPPYHALPPNAAWWAAAVLAMAPASAFAAELPQDATPAQVYGADEASGAAQPEGQAVELVIEGRRSSQTKVFQWHHFTRNPSWWRCRARMPGLSAPR